jgi:hypothetical protein
VFKRPSDEHIVLTAAGEAFDLESQDIELSYKSLLIFSWLRIQTSDRRVTIRNVTLGRLLGFVDPGWDEIEDETEDFLRFLAAVVPRKNWAHGVRSVWGAPTSEQ